MNDGSPSLTAQVLLRLEAVLFELGMMDADLAAPTESVRDADRREVRRRVQLLKNDVDSLMTRLSEVRLEELTN